VKRIPWWAVASAGAAPLLLAGGVALAQSRQRRGYDPIRDTISALAAHGASDRWIMTWAFAGLGGCYFITALGLRPARDIGRFVLAVGGIATLLVAVFAQPAKGDSVAHTVAATVAFSTLATWPVFAARRGLRAPLLRPSVSVVASVVMAALVVWFAAEIHGDLRGLAERAAAGGEALWPLAVAVTTRRALARAAPM
jgi:hypothetical membrane protein